MNIPLDSMFALYAGIIVAGIIGHEIWNRFDTRAERMHVDG